MSSCFLSPRVWTGTCLWAISYFPEKHFLILYFSQEQNLLRINFAKIILFFLKLLFRQSCSSSDFYLNLLLWCYYLKKIKFQKILRKIGKSWKKPIIYETCGGYICTYMYMGGWFHIWLFSFHIRALRHLVWSDTNWARIP